MRIAVTGAFSNIGGAAARELAHRGHTIVTLTNRRPPEGDTTVEAHALRFDRDHLVNALRGCDAFVNTYWVRTPSHGASFATAIGNSRLLVDAAQAAGVSRFVQVSVTHATHDSPSPYYAGKALVDAYIAQRFDSWGVVQPSLVVGPNDVLTSNMAWFVRRSPLILVPKGEFSLQPVLLDDVGALLADMVESEINATVEAIGNEVYTFAEYLSLLAESLHVRRRIARVPRPLFLAAMKLAGTALRDDLVTNDELSSLERGSLVGTTPATGHGSVRDWLAVNARLLGARYVNDRRVRRASTAASMGTLRTDD